MNRNTFNRLQNPPGPFALGYEPPSTLMKPPTLEQLNQLILCRPPFPGRQLTSELVEDARNEWSAYWQMSTQERAWADRERRENTIISADEPYQDDPMFWGIVAVEPLFLPLNLREVIHRRLVWLLFRPEVMSNIVKSIEVAWPYVKDPRHEAGALLAFMEFHFQLDDGGLHPKTVLKYVEG